MKKMFLLMMLMIIIIPSQLQAQDDDIKSVDNVVFYGTDFSLVRFFGAKESPTQLKYGVCQINDLFTSEARKYNIKKYLGKSVYAYNLKQVQKRNEEIDAEKLLTDKSKYEISDADIQEVINDLSYEENDRTGLIFIAENLNKAELYGSYHVVFFDEATKEIIYSKRVTGKPSGIGIRNYWAGSIYKFLKSWKY